MLFSTVFADAKTAQAGLLDSLKNWAGGSGTDVFEIHYALDEEVYETLRKTPSAVMHLLVFGAMQLPFGGGGSGEGTQRCDLRKDAQRVCRITLETNVDLYMGVVRKFVPVRLTLVVKGYDKSPDEYDLYYVPEDADNGLKKGDISREGIRLMNSEENPIRTTRAEMLSGKALILPISYTFTYSDTGTHTFEMPYRVTFTEIDP